MLPRNFARVNLFRRMIVQIMYSSFGAVHSFLIYACSFGAIFARINSYTLSYSSNGEQVEPKCKIGGVFKILL